VTGGKAKCRTDRDCGPCDRPAAARKMPWSFRHPGCDRFTLIRTTGGMPPAFEAKGA
jgi:hypothetical protein